MRSGATGGGLGRRGPRSAGLVLAGIVLTTPCLASAADDAGAYLTPGFLWAPSPGAGHPTGLGFELGSAIYPNGCCQAWGPLLQGEYVFADAPRSHAYRGAFGLQAIWGPLGLDAGWAYRSQAGADYPWATGPQVGAFFSLGIASVGVRAFMPVSHGGPTSISDPGEVGLVVTFKTIVLIYGENAEYDKAIGLGNLGRMPSGRPLLVDAQARVASVARGAGWSSAAPRDPQAQSATLKDRLLRAARGR